VCIAAYIGAVTFGALLNPWNPSLLALPVLLLLISAAAAATGAVGALVIAMLCGSYLVQTHLGTLPLTAAALLFAVIGLVVTHRGRGFDRPSLPILIGVAVVVLMWIPPVGQQVSGDHGNLSAVARFTWNPP